MTQHTKLYNSCELVNDVSSVVLNKWYKGNIDILKEAATSKKVPLIVFWTYGDKNNYCKKLASCLVSTKFTTWMKSSNYIFAYVTPTEVSISSSNYNWINSSSYTSTYYPFVKIYYPDGKVDISTYGKAITGTSTSTTGATKLTDYFEVALRSYYLKIENPKIFKNTTPSRVGAVLIGSNYNNGKEINDTTLKGFYRDCAKFCTMLKASKVPTSNITCLTDTTKKISNLYNNELVSRQKVLTKWDTAINDLNSGKYDLLILFATAHGACDTKGNNMFVLWDNSGIYDTDLYNIMCKAKRGRVLFIIGSCHSGTFYTPGIYPLEATKTKLQPIDFFNNLVDTFKSEDTKKLLKAGKKIDSQTIADKDCKYNLLAFCATSDDSYSWYNPTTGIGNFTNALYTGYRSYNTYTKIWNRLKKVDLNKLNSDKKKTIPQRFIGGNWNDGLNTKLFT